MNADIEEYDLNDYDYILILKRLHDTTWLVATLQEPFYCFICDTEEKALMEVIKVRNKLTDTGKLEYKSPTLH